MMDQPKNIFIAFGEWLEQHKAHRRTIRQVSGMRRSTRWLPSPGSVIFTLLTIGLLLWAQTAGAIPLPGYLNAPDAPSTGTIAYQGRLADAGGNPLTNTVSMEFRLYSVPTGGAPLWEELWTGANSVQVSDGLFNVMLGSLTPIPQSIVTGSASLFLGITAGTDDEMAPRVQLGSVPFAVQALTVPDGSVTTEKIADRAVTQAKLGTDVSLVPPDGSITTAKIADGAVTQAKLGEQPYFFHGAFATPSEWMADVVFNKNYTRFCQAIGRTFSRVDELSSHFHPQRGIGFFYTGWYYTGSRYHPADTHVWGDGNVASDYNVWRYNGGNGCCIGGENFWTHETTAIIWCR